MANNPIIRIEVITGEAPWVKIERQEDLSGFGRGYAAGSNLTPASALRLERALGHAVNNGSFYMNYQPLSSGVVVFHSTSWLDGQEAVADETLFAMRNF